MKRMMYVIAVMLLCLSGCTSSLTVTTNMSDAKINAFPSETTDAVWLILGQPLEDNHQTTPATFHLKRGRQYDIVVTHPDYSIAVDSVSIEHNQTIHFDLTPLH